MSSSEEKPLRKSASAWRSGNNHLARISKKNILEYPGLLWKVVPNVLCVFFVMDENHICSIRINSWDFSRSPSCNLGKLLHKHKQLYKRKQWCLNFHIHISQKLTFNSTYFNVSVFNQVDICRNNSFDKSYYDSRSYCKFKRFFKIYQC